MKLFRAQYADGTVYQQTPYDRSVQRADKNAFFDIKFSPLKPMDELVTFSLIGDSQEHHVELGPGRTLIFFKRTAVGLVAGKPTLAAAYFLGYEAEGTEHVKVIPL